MKIKCYLLFIGLFLSCISFAQQDKLDYYLNQALVNSPLLKDYQNQVLLNQLDSLRIRASYKPQLTGTSNNSYAPTYRGFGYDGAITNGGNFTALIGVNKLLVNKKNLAAQFETLQLQSEAINNTSKISEQDLKRTIIAQYITAYGDLQQLNFTKEIRTLLAKEEIILKKLTENNVYRQVDYLAFLVTLQQQDLTIKQLSVQFRNDYATLNYLSGVNDTTLVILQEPGIYLNQLSYIENSVFFKQYQLDSLKLANSKTLIDVSYKPKFNLFADAGFNSSFAYQGYKNFGTSFGVSAIVPIYDGRQKKIQYNKIAIQESTRLNYKSFFTNHYTQQIAQLTQQLNATEELINDINNQLKYSESLIKVNGKLLETGEVKIADYILALNIYFNAKNLITQNTISRLQIINQINYWNR
jgi:outer membrane protein TolC